MADVRTLVLSFQLSRWDELRVDESRMEAVASRFFDALGLLPEECVEEGERLRAALVEGAFYGGLTSREQRALDRALVHILRTEVGAEPISPPWQAYRFDWVLAFAERHGLADIEPLLHHLAHGRRFGACRQEPEWIPYYAYLDRAELRALELALPEVLETMRGERERKGASSAFRRRGWANDAAYHLVDELGPVISSLTARDLDLLAITGSVRVVRSGVERRL